MKRSLQFALILASCTTLAAAADLAVLRNGNSIRHERREVIGSVTRLYLSDTSSGYIEIPTDQIEHFEKDTDPPPPLKSKPVQNSGTAAHSAMRTTPTPAQLNQYTFTRQDLNTAVAGAGERHQIDPDFINSVIRAESGFHSNAVSKKGAQGLMQLMPQTASQLGVVNTFDPNANVEGGTKYLRELLEKYNFDVPKALAAYNAGPNRVDRYHGIPPYYETQAYIARIIRDFNRKKLAENPALARKTGRQHSAVSTQRSVNSKAPVRSSQMSSAQAPKAKTTAANSAPQGKQTASR